MKTAAQTWWRWAAGPSLALVGVALVRGLAPLLAGRAQAVTLVVGYLLVPAGLAWFASCLGRRAAQRANSSVESH